jgi:glycosyltransferase involved in cell wall biosynthesis
MNILKNHAPNNKFIVIGNFRANRFQDISKTINIGPQSDVIKMVFAGRISFTSDIHMIINEVKEYANLTLTLVGIMDSEFKTWWDATSFKNVRYEGLISNHELIPFLQQFDITVCTYARGNVGIGALHPAPTKVGDSIAAGCVLLCSNQPYLLELVEKYKIGFVYSEATRSAVCKQVSQLSKIELEHYKHNVKEAFTHCSMDNCATELIRCLQ